MRIVSRSNNLSERGSTMLEFSLIIGLVMGLVGVVVDVGLGFRNYSLLTSVTQEAVRDVALTLSTAQTPAVCQGFSPTPTCAQVNTCASAVAQDYITNKYGISGSFAFAPQTVNGGAATGNRYLLSLQGQHTMNCFFCILFPGGLVLSTTSVATIQNNAFTCS